MITRAEAFIQHFLLGLFAVANNLRALAPFLALTMGLMRFDGEVGTSILIEVMGLFFLAIGAQFIITGVPRIYGTRPAQ
jgi:small neutral amino acid transporter SnatA (MarC family)